MKEEQIVAMMAAIILSGKKYEGKFPGFLDTEQRMAVREAIFLLQEARNQLPTSTQLADIEPGR